jgi:hypothetical protein
MDLRSLKPMLPEVAVLLLVHHHTQLAQLKPLERQSFLPVLTVQVVEMQQLPLSTLAAPPVPLPKILRSHAQL